jgi:AAA family ATP:ADP antiporter
LFFAVVRDDDDDTTSNESSKLKATSTTTNSTANANNTNLHDDDDRVTNRLIVHLYGDLTYTELRKFSLLGLTFLFIIGSYWLLRPLKDAVFFSIVGGREYQPIAKMLSVAVVALIVLVYSRLVDLLSRERLFYVVCAFFAVSFFILSMLLAHPTIGLANDVSSPDRLVGWYTYFLIEAYGSITVSMFWSFVASCTGATSASRGYSLIVGGAQVGSIAGPLLVTNAETLGVVPLFALAGCCTVLIAVLLRTFVVFVGISPPGTAAAADDQSSSGSGKKQESGFLEGLKLVATVPYIRGVALVSTIYEVIATITDYQMKVLAHESSQDTASLAAFLGAFGMATNGLALVAALLGTSYALRRFGVRWCLLAYPVSVAGSSLVLFLFASSDADTLLYVFFIVMVLTKGLSYALNNPAKEILYIPTSKDIKFKAKGWIDLFGGRLAKAVGSTCTTALRDLPSAELMVDAGVGVSLVLVVGWMAAASSVGNMYHRLTEQNQVIQ